jgi:hypothetical protein
MLVVPGITSVRNRQVVFPGGQRPQYVVTCTGDNMQENPLTGGEIHIYKYTSNRNNGVDAHPRALICF